MIRACVMMLGLRIVLLMILSGLMGVWVYAAGPMIVGLHPVMVVAAIVIIVCIVCADLHFN